MWQFIKQSTFIIETSYMTYLISHIIKVQLFELSSSGLDEFPPNWFEANFYPKTIQFELTMSIFGNNEKWKSKDIFQLSIEKNKEIKVSFILFYWLVKNPKKKIIIIIPNWKKMVSWDFFQVLNPKIN